MTNKTKNLLKERSKFTKYFCRNGQRESDCDKVLEKSAEYTREIFEAKKQYILKMTCKLEDAFTAPKTYWTIIDHLLYNKKIPAIPPLLMVILFQILIRKLISLTISLDHMYTYKKCKYSAIFFL